MLRSRKKSQAGNVFVIILAGVFLFGALMFTFSKSGQKGSGNLTKHQAKIAAQEILNYARLVEGAVDRVRRNGCSENEISFVNTVVSGYSNPNAPVDGSCDVFNTAGGKIEYLAPQDSWLDNSFEAAWPGNYGRWWFTNNLPIEGIGTPESELRLNLNFVNTPICIEINNLVNITNPSGNPPVDYNDNVINAAQGSFQPPTADNVGDDGGHDLPGKTTFCRTGNTANQFNHVLLAR